ncbi:hypothetical protein [Kozakia baliensis]|uniref:Uncharacterized protein n=1 Tax=Kozakia baliensis TaxID=153496 RepID=A0A1D8USD5_9PROT|nr:hypothetical protein [Kozakia baliensis]AOX16572.1 hypothetical protein A0U89_04910 [Kozakia baliensis]
MTRRNNIRSPLAPEFLLAIAHQHGHIFEQLPELCIDLGKTTRGPSLRLTRPDRQLRLLRQIPTLFFRHLHPLADCNQLPHPLVWTCRVKVERRWFS